jgi:predicted RNA binding protein YcfA (HicA-like mRNA interferase family)
MDVIVWTSPAPGTTYHSSSPVDQEEQCAYMGVSMARPETERSRVVARLMRERWELARHGGLHDVFRHPAKREVITVPRHRTLSPGVARSIAKAAGWL